MANQEKKLALDLKGQGVDFYLLISIILLLGLGSLMVFSSTSASSYSLYGNSYSMLKRHIVFLFVGTIFMLFTSFIDYSLYRKLAIPAYVVTFILLTLVLLIGAKRNNARRWLDLGFVDFQPSEIAKITIIIFAAYILSHPKIKGKARTLWGLLFYVLPIGVLMVLIILEPHFSCVLIMLALLLIIMFVAGVSFTNYLVMGIGSLGALAFAFFSFAHVRERILGFINPSAEGTSDSIYQVTQSLYAIGSGGFFGKGLGESAQKYLYLPEAYNDFIFAVFAEELGFFGVFIVLFLYGIFIWRGYLIAVHAKDYFASLLASGITGLVAIQALMNIAVVTNTIPTTGVALPFFSYGGTSLVFLMAAMGILLNISKSARYNKVSVKIL